MAVEESNSLGGEATFAGKVAARPQRADVSIGDERTFGGGMSIDATLLNDIEVVDLTARYKVEGGLGEGGMGAVVLATDTRLGRKVAIKRILGEAARSNAAIARFLTEARAIAAISHPNVVQIYELGVSKEGPFLVIEYIDGGSLFDRCKAGAIPLEEAVGMFCQVCDGLARAHDAGIVHRDIKPANILLTKDGTAKLTDFGLAKAEASDHQMTMAGAVMGTPDFMPPEQRRDAALVDHRSDLWSLAATLYQAVSGRSPKVIRLHELPQELQPIIAKALEDEKDARYQSAKEFRDALNTVTGGTVVATKASAPSPVIADELQEGQCKACGTITSDLTKKFCRNPKCGASLRVACLKCEAQIPVWDGVCGECGGNQLNLAIELPAVTEAHKHLKAYDYASAIHSLEAIPESFRGEEACHMLAESRSRHVESQQLLADIAARIKQKEIDGLLPVVERAAELRGDRQDLKKIRGQLVERREHRLARAQAAMDAGDARAAAAALEGAAEKDFEQQAAMIEHVRKTAAIETQLADVLKDAKADGVVTPAEAQSVLALCETYLCLNPQGAKVKKLAARCRDIICPPLIRNSVGIELKLIPAGTFIMGEGSDAHKVTLSKPFYMGVYEVTNLQWFRVMGTDLSSEDNDHPVKGVKWSEAVEFCRKLSALPEEQKAGRIYRLPTEAEWEYACRAGTDTKYSFGDDESKLGEYGWFNGNSGGETHPVGEKKPNAWGLFDMHGNVWEWCSDWHGDFPKVAVTDPHGPPTGSERVVRGGSAIHSPDQARSRRRLRVEPGYAYRVGFRLALSLSGAEPVPPEAATGK